MTNLLQVVAVTLRLTNFVMQSEPWPTNTAYYDASPTNLAVSGTRSITAFTGPCIHLDWAPTTSVVLVQQSSNIAGPWVDIRVRHHGDHGWWVNPVAAAMFYRLSLAP